MITEEDSVAEFTRRELERLVMQLALQFVNDVRRFSRTSKAAELRLDCALAMVSGKPSVEAIAKRHKVSPRRVRQACRELRRHLGL
jgi:hypothetical protein